jgi:hypothetical protein
VNPFNSFSKEAALVEKKMVVSLAHTKPSLLETQSLWANVQMVANGRKWGRAKITG